MIPTRAVPIGHPLGASKEFGVFMSSRDRMLEAAIAVIEEHGEAGVRVDQIAAAGGVAKPSLYHFFGSREGLVAAAQAERYRRSLLVGIDQATARLEQCRSLDEFRELVRAWAGSFASAEARRRRAFRVDVLGSSVTRPELQAEIAKANVIATAQLAEFITVARARGWALQSIDLEPEDLAIWLHGLWNGRYLGDIADDPSVVDGWDRVTITLLEFLLLDGD